MKKLIVICLALALFASMGCGNRPQEDKESASAQTGTTRLIYLIDLVDGSRVENVDKYSYIYKNVDYRFNSKKNCETFKKDPEKYLPASQ